MLLAALTIGFPDDASAGIVDPEPCLDAQVACSNGCVQLDFDSRLACACQCAFTACECALGGTGFESICLDAVAQACNGDFTGLVQTNPVLPDAFIEDGFLFNDPISGNWVDPPCTDGFAYQMTGPARFTRVVDFPVGFSQPFTVSVGEQTLGSFGPGESVDFSSFPGGGVTSFEVSGIAPEVDLDDPQAFPLRLEYDQPSASFTMTSLALPEPSGGLLSACALGALAMLRSRGRPSRSR